MPPGKIFGIGFHRTGTTSLDDALNLLGIRSIHGPFELYDDPDHPILAEYDAFTDNPIPLLYRDLDRRFPGSKFILTVRPTDAWLRSVEWLFSVGRTKYDWDAEPVVDQIHRRIYGTTTFDAKVFRDAYLRHRDEVARYFATRPDDLLILDVTNGDAWSRLCGFLNVAVPAESFPASNRATPDEDVSTVPDGESVGALGELQLGDSDASVLRSHETQAPSASVRTERFIYVRDLFITLVSRDLKLRYKRSILGIAWSLLTPLAQLAVFFLIFRVLLPTNVPNFLSFLFTGVLVWNWFQGGLYQATSAIVDNRDLIKRPGFPAAVLPAVTIASNLIHFLLALPILLVFLWFDGIPLTTAFLALPLVIAIQFILTLSLSFFTATFYVAFRDTQHLLGVILNLLFFLSPIFYRSSDLPERYQAYARVNPLVHLIEAYRAIFLDGRTPNTGALRILSVSAIVLLLIGYFFLREASNYFVDEL